MRPRCVSIVPQSEYMEKFGWAPSKPAETMPTGDEGLSAITNSFKPRFPPFPSFVVTLRLSLPGLPPSSTGARTERPCNPLTPASYRPGFFLAIDNNHGKEKRLYSRIYG